jgi:Ras-related protein Rab-32
MTETRELIYKVLVVGNSSVGKTSIIKRYVHDMYSSTYKSTIGVDFALKRLEWDPTTVIQLQLWDIAGQERFGNMTRVYYKQAVGAIIVYDVTQGNTFEDVKTWKSDIDAKVLLPDDTPIPVLLLGNKCDLMEKFKSEEEMDKYCKENGFIAHYLTSAMNGQNIDKAVSVLVGKILSKNITSEETKTQGVITIEEKVPGTPVENKKCCF